MMSKAELARKAGLSTLTIDRVEAGKTCRLDTKRKIPARARSARLGQGLVFGDRRRPPAHASTRRAARRELR